MREYRGKVEMYNVSHDNHLTCQSYLFSRGFCWAEYSQKHIKYVERYIFAYPNINRLFMGSMVEYDQRDNPIINWESMIREIKLERILND